MITRRSLAALSSLERQLLRTQRLTSGQCVRCFHESLRHRAEGSPSVDQGSPPSTPKRGSTRQQRAAMISNEVAMLQNGPPPGDPTTGSGSVTGTYQSDPQPPTTSAGFTETSDSMGGERMGENVSAGREGPNAQGVGRLTGSDENVHKEHPTVRSTRIPSDLQEPAEGEPSVLEASIPGPASQAARVAYTALQGDAASIEPWSKSEESVLRKKLDDVKPLGVPFRHQMPQSNELLRQHFLGSGAGTATPAGNHFEGVVLDRFKAAASPSRSIDRQPGGHRLPKETSRRLAKALVSGHYDPREILAGKTQYKQATMNEVAKRLMLNGTYLVGDGKRVLNKIQTLLPAATTSRSPQKKVPAKEAPVDA